MNILPEYEQFVNELKCFKFHKMRYKKLYERLEDEFYKLSGLKAVDPSKTPSHNFNEAFINEMKDDRFDSLTPIQNELERLKLNIQTMKIWLKMVKEDDEELYNLLNDIYIERKPLKSACREMKIESVTKLSRLMKYRYNEIKKGYE